MPNISRYLILFLMFACNNFPFCEFVTMVYWASIEVLLNLLAPLVSAVTSLDFEQINVFWASGFYPVSIVFNSFSVSKSLSELYFLHSIYLFLLLTLKELILGPWLGFHQHYTVSRYDMLSAESSLKHVPDLIRSFFFWIWVNHLCLICVHLLLVYHSHQFSHTRSDFSRSLRVMISETKIFFHLILVLLSSTLMKQLTCNVSIVSLIHIFDLEI